VLEAVLEAPSDSSRAAAIGILRTAASQNAA
jgi:hypothetical protein